MNSVNIIGRLAKEIELIEEGSIRAKFTLAVNKPNSREVSFIDCITFGEKAKNIKKYRKKGDRVGVTGYINANVYPNKLGTLVKSISIVAQNLSFLDTVQGNTIENELKNFEKNLDVM